ncbi:MAG: mandelate racemase/muconate lactonizing enzyme family protein [Alphaproteobacteria bacterium]|nr:mandelate racemase/muconate lactonizing enzyme family protein [Alphaproteobacteria bacterium]
MKIVRMDVMVLADPTPRDPDAPIEPLAVLTLTTADGVSGLSEVFAVPPGVAKSALNGPDSYFGGMLIGREFDTPEQAWRYLHGRLSHRSRRGWAMICVGAIDVCLWDVFGKIQGKPVYRLLGGNERASVHTWLPEQRRAVVPCGTVFSGRRERDILVPTQLRMVERLARAGFRAVKIEPVESSPDTVVSLARDARSILGDTAQLAVDVGYLWTDIGLAVDVARRLEDLGVAFLETPFSTDALPAYAALAERTTLRLAAGEHSVTRWEFFDLVERGRCQVVQPYATTAGGLTEARRIVEFCQGRGVIVVPGNWSTQILGAASVHLAAWSDITPLIEFTPAEAFSSPLRRAIQELGHPVRDGAIALPERPGLGIELPDELVRRYRVD